EVTAGSRRERLSCDLLAVSNGWNPTLHLTCHLGSKPVWDEAIAAFVAGPLPPGLAVVGAAGGGFGLGEALTTGAAGGARAAADCGYTARVTEPPSTVPEPTAGSPLWRVKGGRGKAFVDFQNDVTDKDVELAHREGF